MLNDENAQAPVKSAVVNPKRPNLAAQTVEKALAGVAGEYFVAAELSRRGYVASLTLKNSRGMDILVTNGAASRSVTVQVKTSQSARGWVLNAKCEKFVADNHFYVFVRLGRRDARPAFHVVPSHTVAKHIAEGHQKWLAKRGRGGRAHQDSTMRIFSDRDAEFLDRWDLLGLDSG